MKKVDRRKKIKAHIRRKGENCDFEITESFALYWWHLLNDVIFDGYLTPPVAFEIKNFRDCGGWCKPHQWNRLNQPHDRRVKIGLLREYWDRKTFLIVLAHEMVHQWEWLNYENMTHGPKFFQWRDTLKLYNIVLTRRYRIRHYNLQK